jgi:hypothetical protein
MKKSFFIPILLFICFSCSADEKPLEKDADFKLFTFPGAVEGSVSIDPAAGMITAKATLDTDMETITPVFVLSQGAKAMVEGEPQTSGETRHDFYSSVEYTLISEDGKTVKTWRVGIVKEYPIGAVWKVKAYRMYIKDPLGGLDAGGTPKLVLSEEPVEDVPPADTVHPYRILEIPDFMKGFKGIAYGNSFLNPQRLPYEIRERQQIYIRCGEYMANELIVRFKESVDFAYASEFAANSGHKIFPRKSPFYERDAWWTFDTDGTEDLFEIINELNQQQHPNVEYVIHNPIIEGGLYPYQYSACIVRTEKFKFSGNELIFIDAWDKPEIWFERIEKK